MNPVLHIGYIGAIHYAVKSDGLTIYVGSEPVLHQSKTYQLVDTAKQALCGKLIIPTAPEPIEITDHPWLLRLAGDVSLEAARSLQREGT